MDVTGISEVPLEVRTTPLMSCNYLPGLLKSRSNNVKIGPLVHALQCELGCVIHGDSLRQIATLCYAA